MLQSSKLLNDIFFFFFFFFVRMHKDSETACAELSLILHGY